LPAVIILGARLGRYTKTRSNPIPVSNIPFLALGSWILAIGWFGFNVMSAQSITGISGLVAVNSLMSMVGGVLAALLITRRDPGFVHNGALAGLVAICASSDIVHPVAALFIGAIASIIFIKCFTWETEKLKIDDVLGVWPLHGIVGSWGGIATGIFGYKALGGLGGVTFTAQFLGTALALCYAVAAGTLVYKILTITIGIRLNEDEEFRGSDLSIHNVDAYPEETFKLR
jgi:Amt family ammonium transporter